MLIVHVRFYASLRDHFEAPVRELRVSDSTTVEKLVSQEIPTALRGGLRYAVNDCFVGADRVLRDGDVVDLLPPFGGG